ncbi:hypothetical protein, variant [Phytophthora nicotianae CJ01A1]|uniref:Uncharacterized protein n=6 Tax=Phytophthora nicotianae TaxID=4792 RepID=W2REH6_PHYN3|nr:hypothetical protein, variant [Phytophthora nicotianae INRA-310]ETI49831.1 hypothetical protein, variant [Phytophthora nicotianae P1569]ETK89514.1 hypothetical protein, variant [Phytophthora nicotianae]ETO78337.1 hypothetical protein, variant [Phytophthora nicotianae P1976]ETP19386.1 hypothetical protein, variant [Phytophthora nicotianae CJ01A1]ETP47387.1 hypothetical protein, variant [Phytophthora nicotianae P10297]
MSCGRPFKRRKIIMENAAYEFHQIQDEVKKITQEIPEKVLSGHTYHAADVHEWTTDISSQCLKELKGVANGSAGFKYIVTGKIEYVRKLTKAHVLGCYSELHDPAEEKRWIPHQLVVLLGR